MRFSRNKPIVMTSDVLFCSADDSKTQDVQFSIKNDKSIKSSHVRSWTRVCTAFIFPCLEKKHYFSSSQTNNDITARSTWWVHGDMVLTWCHILHRLSAESTVSSVKTKSEWVKSEASCDQLPTEREIKATTHPPFHVHLCHKRFDVQESVLVCISFVMDRITSLNTSTLAWCHRKGCQRWHLGLQTACDVHFLHNASRLSHRGSEISLSLGRKLQTHWRPTTHCPPDVAMCTF